MKTSSLLHSEFTLFGMRLKNRIGLAPMTRISASNDGEVTDIMIKYYASFAKGGFSFLITEGVYPDQFYSQAYFNQPGIATNKQCLSWKKLIDVIHRWDAKIFLQLMHAGIQGQGNIYKKELIGPSSIPAKGKQLSIYRGEGFYPKPKAMFKHDIDCVIEQFAKAARRAQQAGFDGVEIHGANGYLLDNFLTDYLNLCQIFPLQSSCIITI